MSSHLVTALHQEERSIIAELRASRQFQRLEGVRKLLSLYDAQPATSTGIDGLEADRAAAPLRMVSPPPAMAVGQNGGAQAIPMPGPTLTPADGGPVDAARASGAEAGQEHASVVSSVRAALLGIGKA